MKQKKGVAVLLSVVAILILAWLFHQRPLKPLVAEHAESVQTNEAVSIQKPDRQVEAQSNAMPANAPLIRKAQDSRAQFEQRKQAMTQEALQWRTPILYYGKVIDESNQPISGVKVSFNTSSVNEALTKEQYDNGTVTTDERGIFKIDGVRGVGMVFQLSHPNYYLYPGNIMDYDIRDYPKKGALPNTEENALVFRMHSKGHPVTLVHRRGGTDVPVNSGSATVEFYGQQDKQVIGTLQIEAAGDTPKNWNPTPYDWSVRLTVPNGGLVESTNQFDFVAPDSGYQQSIEIDMGKDQPGWSDTVNKSYFVKLPNGYARMAIHMRAKTPLYVSLEYYFNPDGSTDLEPAQ